MLNKKFTLAGRPIGRPISDDDFHYKEEELRDLNDRELLLENMVIEFQPAQKGWMENISNYVAPLEIGDVMRCSGIARVLDSKSEKFKKGDIAFLPSTGSFCFFIGNVESTKTMTPIGKFLDETNDLKNVKPGDVLRLYDETT